MSSTIEYRHAAVVLDRAAGLTHMQQLLPTLEIDEWTRMRNGEPVPLVFVESGCSNTVEASGRLARSWKLDHFGPDALMYAIRASEFVERENTKLRGKSVQAETYIRHYRNAIKNAMPVEPDQMLPSLVFKLDDRLFKATEHDKFMHERVARDPFTQYLRDAGYLSEVTERGMSGMADKTFMQLLAPGDQGPVWMAVMTWLTIHCDVPDRNFNRSMWLRPDSCYGLESWLSSAELVSSRKSAA